MFAEAETMDALSKESDISPKLTPKQARFIIEYERDRNASAAAIRAGYSDKGARQRGSELLAKRNIREAIEKLNEAAVERAGIDQDWVIERLRGVHDASMERTMSGTAHNPAAANRSLELIGKHGGMWQEGHVAGDINIQVNVHPHGKGDG